MIDGKEQKEIGLAKELVSSARIREEKTKDAVSFLFCAFSDSLALHFLRYIKSKIDFSRMPSRNENEKTAGMSRSVERFRI